MARKTKAGTPASAAKSLQEALAFCAVAFKDIGPDYQTHVVLHGNKLHAFDGVIAAGHPIDDDLIACPHGGRLRDALARPGTGLRLTLAADGSALSVTVGGSAGFRARVPCVALDAIAPYGPDPMLGPIGTQLAEGCGAVAHLASNTGTTVLESSILITADTLVATNRATLIEYKHGLAFPREFIIPRVFATALLKCKLQPVGIGWSDGTMTIHYDNGAWLRTQLYAEKWPDYARVFTGSDATTALPLDPAFFTGCADVAPFANGEIGTVHISADKIATDNASVGCATPGVAERSIPMAAKQLAHIAGRVDRAEWSIADDRIVFHGDNIRAAVMCIMAAGKPVDTVPEAELETTAGDVAE